MNTKFKIGSVEIPVPTEEGTKAVALQGLEIEVTDLDLKDYLLVLKEMPEIILKLRAAVEADIDDVLGVEEEEDETPKGMPSFLDFLKAQAKVDEEMSEGLKQAIKDASDFADKHKTMSGFPVGFAVKSKNNKEIPSFVLDLLKDISDIKNS